MYVRKARSRTARRELDAALRSMEPRVAEAFLEAARHIRSRATLKSMAAAIQRGDIAEAVRLSGVAQLANRLRGIGLEPGATSFERQLMSSLEAGGVAGMRQLPRAAALSATLDLTNPEAVRYLSTTLPTLIREVGEETIRAVNDAVLRGFTEGRPAPLIAREIRDSIGLTEKQSRAIGNFRRQLETGELGVGQRPWDRRLSATERAQARSFFTAAAQGSPADQARIDSLVSRYYESLVNRRSKDIARTEVHRAFTEGQQELWNQAEERGLIDPTTTRRIWIVTPDDRLRPDHAAIPGMNPDGVGLDEMFDTPFGPVSGPNDPVPELINCRCTVALEIRE